MRGGGCAVCGHGVAPYGGAPDRPLPVMHTPPRRCHLTGSALGTPTASPDARSGTGSTRKPDSLRGGGVSPHRRPITWKRWKVAISVAVAALMADARHAGKPPRRWALHLHLGAPLLHPQTSRTAGNRSVPAAGLCLALTAAPNPTPRVSSSAHGQSPSSSIPVPSPVCRGLGEGWAGSPWEPISPGRRRPTSTPRSRNSRAAQESRPGRPITHRRRVHLCTLVDVRGVCIPRVSWRTIFVGGRGYAAR